MVREDIGSLDVRSVPGVGDQPKFGAWQAACEVLRVRDEAFVERPGHEQHRHLDPSEPRVQWRLGGGAEAAQRRGESVRVVVEPRCPLASQGRRVASQQGGEQGLCEPFIDEGRDATGLDPCRESLVGAAPRRPFLGIGDPGTRAEQDQ